MSRDVLRSTARAMVEQLARGDFEELLGGCIRSRLTTEDLDKVLRGYGRKLVPPPVDAYDDLDAVQVKGAAVPTWSVRAPLWTDEEGRSDLTLELTIALGPGEPSVELDDLHVL